MQGPTMPGRAPISKLRVEPQSPALANSHNAASSKGRLHQDHNKHAPHCGSASRAPPPSPSFAHIATGLPRPTGAPWRPRPALSRRFPSALRAAAGGGDASWWLRHSLLIPAEWAGRLLGAHLRGWLRRKDHGMQCCASKSGRKATRQPCLGAPVQAAAWKRCGVLAPWVLCVPMSFCSSCCWRKGFAVLVLMLLQHC